MSKRTRQRRSRPRRDTGSGVSSPSRGRTETKWDAVGKRIDVSYDVIGHPQQRDKPVEEGKHYKTLAYTDWADTFVPTVIQWNHGAVDSFTDPAKSRENQRKALQHAKPSSMSQSIRLPESKIPELKEAVQQMKKAAKEEKEKYGKPGPMTLKDLRYYQAELRKEREKRRKLKPDARGTAREGDRVSCTWFDDPKYITGTVKRDSEGLYIETPNGPGYIKDAHHVTKSSGMSQSIRLPKAQKKFGGLWYVEHTGAYNKAEAQKKAEEIKSRGYKVRVEPTGEGYTVYAHKLDKPSSMSQSIRLPVGGGTLKVGGKEYVWRGGDVNYRAAQEKAEDLRKQGHRAVIRKERVAGKPAYVVYARKEGEPSDVSRSVKPGRRLKAGDRVKVTVGSGLDSGKTVTIVNRGRVKVDGGAVPTNIEGAYQPIDWSKEAVVRLDDGRLISMYKNRLKAEEGSR
ncbi:MAG: hypothetical protein ABIJ47_10555 [Candidatus Bathyarchaeota archaeon]